MILRKIHIDSFGKLQNYDEDLTEGLNIILHDNGWGKSTLASFIRVMFYGFENEKKRSEIENERRRYTPWLKGNAYGGYLVFEVNEKKYRVERYFEKNNDIFRLYDVETNLESKDYTGKIGEEIFGIDRDSFSNTVFVAQQACITEVTSEISAKIGNVSSEMADMARYEAACEKLHDEQNRLTSKRSTGLISKLKNEVAELKNQTTLQENYEKSLDKVNSELSEIQDKIVQRTLVLEELHNKRDNLSKYNALLAEKKEYDALANEQRNAEREWKKLQDELGEKIPDVKLLDEVIATSGRLQEMKVNLDDECLYENEKAEYSKLADVFASGVPSESELSDVKFKIEAIQEQKDLIEGTGFSKEENRKYEELKAKYADNSIEQREIEECIDSWKKRESLQNLLPVYRSNESNISVRLKSDAENKKAERERTQKEESDSRKKKAQLIMIGGIVISVMSILLYVLLKQIVLMGLILVIGIGVLVFGILQSLKKQELSNIPLDDWENSPELVQVRKDLIEAQESVARIEEKIKDVLSRLQMQYQENKTQDILYDLQRELADYAEYEKRLSDHKEKLQGGEERLEKLTTEVVDFMSRYFVTEDATSLEAFYTIQEKIKRYSLLKDKHEKYEADRIRLEEVKKKQEDFLDEYELKGQAETEQLNTFREKIGLLEVKKEDYRRRNEDLEKYLRSHDISKFSCMEAAVDDQSAEQITEQIGLLENELEQERIKHASYIKQQEEFEEKLEVINEKFERLQIKEQELQNAENAFNIVSKTLDYIMEAKENFLKHYLEPMQSSFDKYYTMLSGDETDAYDLDVNFNVKKREQGQLRDIELLSEGYKDLISLCRRMAMIDAMYKDEMPFLIFDDPFVNQDDEKLKHGVSFLREVGKEYQVIYLTCHTSRA